MNLVDTHAHLDFVPERESLEEWLERAKVAGVTKIITIGTSVEGSKKCVEIAESRFPIELGMTNGKEVEIYATVGIHAEDGKGDIEKYGGLDKCIEELRKILLRQKPDQDDKLVVGIGECGYDIRRTADNLPARNASHSDAGGQLTTDQEIEFQHELFSAQIGLAAELELPLVVHCRNAWEDTFRLLSNYFSSDSEKFSLRSNNNLRGVFHSWTGDWEAAKRALNLGFYISFSGIVTFKNAPDIQDVAKKMPLDKLLLETDSPFLSPEPLRGRKNEPKNVRIIAEFISSLRSIPMDELASITTDNAGRLFGF